tara:strand:- start:1331 stop:1906 length:576 start_codon:yes stop_codon:yes gene_type:complete
MSQDNTQNATGSIERPPVEKAVAQEVVTDNQNQDSKPSAEFGELIAESKKYRNRAQEAESKLAKMEKRLAQDRENTMAEQNKWQELAEERGAKLSEQEPIIEAAMNEMAAFREELLADFDEEDKEAFGELSLTQLRTLHKKLINESNAVRPTDGTPARTVNPENKDWLKMDQKDRRDNWQNILDNYRVRKK